MVSQSQNPDHVPGICYALSLGLPPICVACLRALLQMRGKRKKTQSEKEENDPTIHNTTHKTNEEHQIIVEPTFSFSFYSSSLPGNRVGMMALAPNTCAAPPAARFASPFPSRAA